MATGNPIKADGGSVVVVPQSEAAGRPIEAARDSLVIVVENGKEAYAAGQVAAFLEGILKLKEQEGRQRRPR